jgi:hypothetical protein
MRVKSFYRNTANKINLKDYQWSSQFFTDEFIDTKTYILVTHYNYIDDDWLGILTAFTFGTVHLQHNDV